MPGHPRIAVLGSRSAFTRQAVDSLCGLGVPPVALIVDATPDRRTRGPIAVEVRETAAAVADAHGVEVVRAPDPNHPEAIAALERIRPDLLLLACLPHVVRRATRETARLGALNLHPSALPRYRGPDPVFRQLRAGVTRAGVTVHVATGAVDAGPVVAQRWLEVRAGIGSEALTAALVRLGARALAETLPDIERRIREAVPRTNPPRPASPIRAPRTSGSIRHGRPSARTASSREPGGRERRSRFQATGARSRSSGRSDSIRHRGASPQSRIPATSSRSASPMAYSGRSRHDRRRVDGRARAVPPSAQASTASSSSNPNVDMSRMRAG